MPKFINDGDSMPHTTASNYHFSAVKMEKLGAAEYTLVNIALDASGSVDVFRKQLEAMIKTVVKSCQKSPRADNLMLRLTIFNNSVKEVHGFKLLSDIKESDYDDFLICDGLTALSEAADEGVQSLSVYGKQLTENEYLANGLLVVITDGMGNCGRATPAEVKKSIENARKSEMLESVSVVLIGVTNGAVDVDAYLMKFAGDTGITQYIDIGNATPGKIAKLGGFISHSISSTSQALGSGGPSQPVQFPV